MTASLSTTSVPPSPSETSVSSPPRPLALPETFVSQMHALLGAEAPEFFAALEAAAPTSIRFNPFKIGTMEKDVLGHGAAVTPQSWAKSMGIRLSPVPWSEYGYYLSERPSFTQDPLFHAGVYYVQEASSMKLEHTLKQALHQLLLSEHNPSELPLLVLDLCAAPGGKSTHLASLLPSDACLVSNEYVRNRALVLRDNLTKWGHPNQIICHNAPGDLGRCTDRFDLIVADVPCSGEGMFRKDPAAIREWSPDAVRMCAQRQREIIESVWPALKPNGCLIYSTCTYNRAENEDNLAWICSELGAEILQQEHCYPHRTQGEGFFIALLQKEAEGSDQGAETHCRGKLGTNGTTGTTGTTRKPGKTEKPGKSNSAPVSVPKAFDSIRNCLKNSARYRFLFREPDIMALPESILPAYESVRPYLHILSAGIKLGEIKGKDFIPDYALAQSSALDTKAFPSYDCSPGEALQYLRMDSFCAHNLPKGYALVCFQKLPLGWIKHLGTRSNNLLPKELRIRTSGNGTNR